MVPTIRNTPLKLTKKGYVRQLGTMVQGGSKLKFYLGRDMAVAAQRRQWIEAIYVENCRLFGHSCWCEPYLGFARQIERLGSALYTIDASPSELSHVVGESDFSFIQRLRDVGVPISIDGQAAYARVKLAGDVTPKGKPATTKLHDAIRNYKGNRVEKYKGGFQGAKRLDKQIEKFFEIEDCWLHELEYSKIKDFVDHWRARPVTGHGKRCSKTYAQNQITEFFKFLSFTEATKGDEFECPNLSSIDRSVKRLASDTSGNEIRDLSWRPDELREVYKTAEPLAKLIVGLGLNACSGAAELGRIRVDDFLFGCKHPYHEIIRYDGEHDWLITTRRKAYTHSEALLWPWVVELVKTQIDVCKANGWDYLFTENGEPLYLDDEIYEELSLALPRTEKPEQRFVKRYDRAVGVAFRQKRIRKKRSLGKLRKTFSNYLTMKKHADLASLALAHQTDEDQQLKHYANKPYARLFKATLKAGKEWDLTRVDRQEPQS